MEPSDRLLLLVLVALPLHFARRRRLDEGRVGTVPDRPQVLQVVVLLVVEKDSITRSVGCERRLLDLVCTDRARLVTIDGRFVRVVLTFL